MLNKIFILLLVCFSFSGICSANSDADNVIIAFGDSITVGLWENDLIYGDGSRTGGYEPDLEALSASKNNFHIVYNYGRSGEKTIEDGGIMGGVERLIYHVLPYNLNAKYVLILEGTNDYWGGWSKETTVYNLGLMIDACRAQGIEPILATLTPEMSWPTDIKNIPAYNELIIALSIEKDVKLVDMYTPMVDEWISTYGYGEDYADQGYPDYTHLSREGYQKMAELWYEGLFPYQAMPWLHLLLK